MPLYSFSQLAWLRTYTNRLFFCLARLRLDFINQKSPIYRARDAKEKVDRIIEIYVYVTRMRIIFIQKPCARDLTWINVTWLNVNEKRHSVVIEVAIISAFTEDFVSNRSISAPRSNTIHIPEGSYRGISHGYVVRKRNQLHTCDGVFLYRGVRRPRKRREKCVGYSCGTIRTTSRAIESRIRVSPVARLPRAITTRNRAPSDLSVVPRCVLDTRIARTSQVWMISFTVARLPSLCDFRSAEEKVPVAI